MKAAVARNAEQKERDRIRAMEREEEKERRYAAMSPAERRRATESQLHFNYLMAFYASSINRRMFR
jgi:hypothetical protein